jgi:hypothetical protein
MLELYSCREAEHRREHALKEPPGIATDEGDIADSDGEHIVYRIEFVAQSAII